ncbi:MAG: Tn3 family transposase, partial [Anaerolineae bacterium]|nr:Tn3 family transposase [Anaerolineae bacterium]
FLAKFPELADADVFIQRAQEALDVQMAEANRVWPGLQEEVWIEDDTVHLARLEAKELPDGITQLQDRLVNLFPRIGIAQLLLEVNHWIGVDQVLTNLNVQEHSTENLTAKKIAVLMAEGMNIGLQNMSYCVQGMSYAELAGVNDRYFREDTLHQAIVAVVNFYHKLPITRHWGDGTTSSSDGQIFGVPVNTVYAQYHPESPSRSGRAVSVYTHVSDHGIPFYGQVIHHLSQEGAYVLDGLLYHETDLTPQHHYVDTGGYQDTLWGACHLLGFSLEPRIRDIGEMKLFRIRRKVEEYQNIQVLFSDAINTRAIRENWDNLLRLMASIHAGIVPASQILRKLDVYHTESGVFKALREVGRIAKTMFLLDYFTQRQIRHRIQKGLNRVESYHALVRTLFIGQSGEIRQRELEAQLNRTSCLQLVAAMVMTWNAAYLSAAVNKLEMEGVSITPEQLAHILPVLSEHINRLGRYEFNPAAETIQTDLSALPLRSAAMMADQFGLNN